MVGKFLILAIAVAAVNAQGQMSLKRCPSGRNMNCMMPPCQGRTCPAFPGAECRNNYCDGCNVEFWVGSTEVTSQCDQSTPSAAVLSENRIDTTDCGDQAMFCFRNPCQGMTCASRPTAVCRSDCQCKAVFWEGASDVTAMCQGASLDPIKPQPKKFGSPGIASRKSCEGKPRVNCQMAPCSMNSCPRYPNAQCRNNYCGGCTTEFWVGFREVTAECSEAELSLSTGSQAGIASRKSCEGKPRVNCQMAPCSMNSCPRYPNAQCRNNYCGDCTTEFWVGFREVTAECSEAELSLSTGSQGGAVKGQTSSDMMQPKKCRNACLVSPCLFSYCPGAPGAECRFDTCKGCTAEYWMGNTDVTSRCKQNVPSFGRLGRFFSRFRQPTPRRSNFLSPWYALLDGLF